ncbi:MAG: hypothetical protein KC492_23835 [Myxococcales bacterium]|nr:hypothetical protein [Myxococcales bacterium]
MEKNRPESIADGISTAERLPLSGDSFMVWLWRARKGVGPACNGRSRHFRLQVVAFHPMTSVLPGYVVCRVTAATNRALKDF